MEQIHCRNLDNNLTIAFNVENQLRSYHSKTFEDSCFLLCEKEQLRTREATNCSIYT